MKRRTILSTPFAALAAGALSACGGGEDAQPISLKDDMPANLLFTQESVNLSGMTLAGTGPNYTGYGSNGAMVDGAEFGVRTLRCPTIRLRDLDVRNIRGAGVDIQGPSAWKDKTLIDGVFVDNSYRGVHLRNSAEGVLVSNTKVANCVFGIDIDSGNNNVANCEVVYCSIGIRLTGGANNAHGTFTGVNSRHNTYNLSCQNVTLGETFVGCNFSGGQGGADQGILQMVNSKGILLQGGQIAYNDVTVDATSQLALRGVVLRGPVNFIVSSGGVLDCKDCIVMAGATVRLNGLPFSGNN